MTGLDPELMSLADRNRRVIAERCGWPDGVLEECERLDYEHPRIPTEVFAATVAELAELIATVDAEVEVATAYRNRLWGSMRSMRPAR
ncbi:hypothetical protein AB0F72_17850 [Actinoplanes sp. NPDC023936]|uniref:hypothetical protein n=1 Tax=Actinoplanes sp. NPDC023936 TaxID=3154910 RepID=UPI0033DFADB4